jgi:hypothetical protein
MIAALREISPQLSIGHPGGQCIAGDP